MRSIDLKGKCELGHVFENLFLCDALARQSLFFPGKAASQKAEILKSEGQLTAKKSQSSFKKPTLVLTPGISRPMPQSGASRALEF
jgi:hypothetical protein